MKTKIIKKLEVFNKEQGIAFMSKNESEDYFKGLVEIIEDISTDISTLKFKKRICNLIALEQKWCLENSKNVGTEYRKGFINGLKQSKSLINKCPPTTL